MIDWLTMRYPLDRLGDLDSALRQRLEDARLHLYCVDRDGCKVWEKYSLDIDAVRSDTPGLLWTVTGDGKGYYLTVGASPASLKYGCNVFGPSELNECARILVRHASVCLGAVLPRAEDWQVRRLDVTHNYDLKDSRAVKQALRILLGTDSARRKAQSDNRGGDTVYWSPTSDLLSGKAYHKGPQLTHLTKTKEINITDEQIALADRLLRLELRLGSRWFRRLEQGQLDISAQDWRALTEPELNRIHSEFFARFVGTLEVVDMGALLTQLEKVAPTKGQALAAHRTWALLRTIGFEEVKRSVPKPTFYRHLALLRGAGLSDADLCASNVVPLRRTVLELGRPVTSWEDLRRAA